MKSTLESRLVYMIRKDSEEGLCVDCNVPPISMTSGNLLNKRVRSKGYAEFSYSLSFLS
jgi:hypothetical protein